MAQNEQKIEELLQKGEAVRGVTLVLDLARRPLRKALFEQCELGSSDFNHADLTGAIFRDCQLAGTTFHGAVLHHASFSRCDLTGCDLEEATLEDSEFVETTLDRVRLPRADLRRAKLRDCSLAGADLTAALVTPELLRSSRLDKTILAEITLENADLSGANLARVSLKKARLKKLVWNWPFFLMIIKQSLPFSILVLLMTLYNRLDPVMLESLLNDPVGNSQAGIYASGFRLLDAANMIAYLFAVLLVPIFSRMIKQHQSIEHILKLAFTLLITTAIIVSVGSFYYSYELMDLLYDSHIQESSAVFRLLMGGFVAVSATYIFGTLLTANGNLKELSIISFCSLLINFGINLLLIPRLFAIGSAYASLVTQFFTAIAQVILVQRIFKFRINYRYIFSLLLFITGVVLFNLISRQIHFDTIGLISKPHAWLLNFIIMIFFSFGLAAFLRLLSLRSIQRILKEERS